MSFPIRPRHAGVCWNCDRVVRALTEITIRLRSGGCAHFSLCDACYTMVYRPLVHAIEGKQPVVSRNGH